MHKIPRAPRGPLKVLKDPCLLSSGIREPDHTGSQPRRLSHPLINSTQRHFLHSLTVPRLCVCVCVSCRHRAEPLPCQRWKRWEKERWQIDERHREQTAAGLKAAALLIHFPLTLFSPLSPLGGLHQPQSLLVLLWQSGGVGEDFSYSTSRL